MNISIVIPVYHEEKTICKVLDRIAKKVKTSHEVIVVSDGLEEPTYQVVQKYKKKYPKQRILLLRNPNKGVMNTIKLGFKYAKGKATVVTMADMSDDIGQVDEMFALIQKGNDIVCASRFMKGGKKIGGPWLKTLLSKLADVSLHFLVGIPTHDATNAFKMYGKRVLKNIKIESTGGFEYSLEIMLKTYRKGYSITEIPTIWRDRESGKSNFKLMKWLPNYLKWYLYGLSLVYIRFIKNWFGFSILGLYFFSLSLTLLQIGNQIKNGYQINSTLDLSWIMDSAERFLHGYIAGRDYIFTYGPLFQLIQVIPAKMFNIPSYISILLSPIILNALIFVSLFVLVSFLTQNKLQKLFLLSFLLFIVGLVFIDPVNELIKVVFPIIFGLFWYKCNKSFSAKKLIFLSIVPSVLGLYAYDMFAQSLLIGAVMSIYFVIKQRSLKFTVPFMSIIIFQVVISFIISVNFSYTHNSIVTIQDYFYIMNTSWEFGKSNYLFVFPVIMLLLIWYIHKNKLLIENHEYLVLLSLLSLLQLRSGMVRSDGSHILMSLFPSIITTCIILFFLIQKRKEFFILFSLLFVILPFRTNYFDLLSVKNLTAIISVIKNKSDFFSLYKFPENYYFSKKELLDITKFIKEHKDEVFVYPYDSYLLNIEQTTFNSFPLQFYEYSNSRVEQEAIRKFDQNPPKYVILGIDTKGAIALDNISNLTRNSIFTKWLIQHYEIYQKQSSYLILKFEKDKAQNLITDCSIYTLTIIEKNTFFDKIVSLIKPPQYWLINRNERLPLTGSSKKFLIVNIYNKGDEISNLFNSAKINKSADRNTNVIIGKKYFYSKETQVLSQKDYQVFCSI